MISLNLYWHLDNLKYFYELMCIIRYILRLICKLIWLLSQKLKKVSLYLSNYNLHLSIFFCLSLSVYVSSLLSKFVSHFKVYKNYIFIIFEDAFVK